MINSEKLSQVIVEGMEEKKALEITIINLKKIPFAIADYYVLCSGNSDTQIDAIAESVKKYVWEQVQQDPRHHEGGTVKEWILIDYFDVIVHIFNKEKRTFFALEELFADAEIKRIEDKA